MRHNATNTWIPVLLFPVDVSDARVSLELTSTHLRGTGHQQLQLQALVKDISVRAYGASRAVQSFYSSINYINVLVTCLLTYAMVATFFAFRAGDVGGNWQCHRLARGNDDIDSLSIVMTASVERLLLLLLLWCWCWRLCSHPGDSRKIVGRTEGGKREKLASGDPPSAPATSAVCTRHLSFNYSLKRRSSPKFPNNYDVCQARNQRHSVVVAGAGPAAPGRDR